MNKLNEWMYHTNNRLIGSFDLFYWRKWWWCIENIMVGWLFGLCIMYGGPDFFFFIYLCVCSTIILKKLVEFNWIKTFEPKVMVWGGMHTRTLSHTHTHRYIHWTKWFTISSSLIIIIIFPTIFFLFKFSS
mgnify:CR=1 FL=1